MGRKTAEFGIIEYASSNTASFDQAGFNEVDGLLMTQIANMDLGKLGIGIGGESKSIKDVYDAMAKGASNKSLNSNEMKLLEAMANNPRYQNMKVSNYVKNPVTNGQSGFSSIGAEADQEQFAAATITYTQNGKTYHYMSFEATNGTDEGWIEDFEMICSGKTQAQADSVAYMNMMNEMFPDGDFVGGGHSKGGNDFQYGYMFCDPEMRARIMQGYVYDSPGMTDEVINRSGCYDDYLRITKDGRYCPQDSIIGQLLTEADNSKYIHSVEEGVEEHDPYSWEVNPNDYSFVPDEQSEESKKINQILDGLVDKMNPEQREALYILVKLILSKDDGDGIDGLMDTFENLKKQYDQKDFKEFVKYIIEEYYDRMTDEEKELFWNSMKVLAAWAISIAWDELKTRTKQWIDEKIDWVKQKVNDIIEAAKEWIHDRINDVKEFFGKVRDAIVNTIKKVAKWVLDHSAGAKAADKDPYICFETDKLSLYASRLNAVNRRIVNLDNSLSHLYRHAGLFDIWQLIDLNLSVHYSPYLLACAADLEVTRAEFENLESELLKYLG